MILFVFLFLVKLFFLYPLEVCLLFLFLKRVGETLFLYYGEVDYDYVVINKSLF